MMTNDRSTFTLKNKHIVLGSVGTIATFMLNKSLILLLSTTDTFLTSPMLFWRN